jgi:hypothetical protein
MDLESTMPRHKNIDIVWFYLYEVSKTHREESRFG